ncbi:hypothetical protein [Liquorilactobacillus mali]|uniref:Uncharacterized protein n=1 Tax=Liquorilactobacillus mali KCTC 3596 = DSM 20444 TaxID=1046596 RepID=A0A0R2DZL6_9LACO|nr:hypothetical protein [Liquorilactobacillus mali]KRN09378.1 hypothetical protein FD00_GL001101 [Liquorilactobacillus mali KCTC 3596 = DSM 20444]
MSKYEEQFKKKLLTYSGGAYSLISSYTKSTEIVELLHSICNNVWKITPASLFKNKSTCPYCKGFVCDNDTFKYKVRNTTGNEYSFIEPYTTSLTEIKCKHNKCGKIFITTPNRFFAGSKCTKCGSGHKKTTEEFAKELCDKYDKEYIVVSEYLGAREPIRIKHANCNWVFKTTPNDILSTHNNGCPTCHAISKHERFIHQWFVDNNIKDIPQYKVEGLKDKKDLRFDFYLPDYNIMIEYDGKQHYKAVDFFGGKEYKMKLNIHDRQKDKYCKDNNIKMIRLTYKFNEDEILDVLNETFLLSVLS